MSQNRSNRGLGALALVPLVCCVGLPLVAAVGVSVALAARVGGGIALASLVLLAALFLLAQRARRRRDRHVSLSGRDRS